MTDKGTYLLHPLFGQVTCTIKFWVFKLPTSHHLGFYDGSWLLFSDNSAGHITSYNTKWRRAGN